jgi:hypothetical protein
VYFLKKKYNNYVQSNTNVIKLIKMCDTNKDQVIDGPEMHKFLSVRKTRSYLDIHFFLINCN